jgi:acyl carrier protein
MQSQEEIYRQVSNVLVELFELDPAKVVWDAHLYEDLDIDSLDAIDLILELKELTGRKVQPEQFKQVRTVRDVVNAVHHLMLDETAA